MLLQFEGRHEENFPCPVYFLAQFLQFIDCGSDGGAGGAITIVVKQAPLASGRCSQRIEKHSLIVRFETGTAGI